MKKGIWIIVAALLSLGAIVGANALVSTTNVNTMKKELSAEEQIKIAPKAAVQSLSRQKLSDTLAGRNRRFLVTRRVLEQKHVYRKNRYAPRTSHGPGRSLTKHTDRELPRGAFHRDRLALPPYTLRLRAERSHRNIRGNGRI